MTMTCQTSSSYLPTIHVKYWQACEHFPCHTSPCVPYSVLSPAPDNRCRLTVTNKKKQCIDKNQKSICIKM